MYMLVLLVQCHVHDVGCVFYTRSVECLFCTCYFMHLHAKNARRLLDTHLRDVISHVRCLHAMPDIMRLTDA